MEEKWYDWAYPTKEYLHDIPLVQREFPADSADHVHCEVCWAKISRSPEDMHDGYYDAGSGSWICRDCFAELGKLFHWTETP